MPTLSLDDLARLIGVPRAALTAPVEPENGLRVWGSSGIATVHADGCIRLAVKQRRIHTVVCDEYPDMRNHEQHPHLGGGAQRRSVQ